MCTFPYLVRNKSPVSKESHTPVPCGKCYDCKMRTVSQWAFRLKKEEEVSFSSFFITLTYNTDSVPISPKGFMTLSKTDVQKFLKRLRKYEDDRIKYFAVGEYGSKNERPHYHIIIFNVQNQDNLQKAWALNNTPLGEVHIGYVSGASVTYTLKYMMKDGKIPKHKNDDRLPEFRLMSKKLGDWYLSKQVIQFHRRRKDQKYITIEDGIKVPMPRYYAEKIWSKEELKEQSVKLKKLAEQKKDEKERKFRRENPDRDFTRKEYEDAQYRNRKIKQSTKRRDL